MKNLNRQSARDSRRSGFTLIELLLVIAIIAILSSLGLAVMAGAEENALRSRTKAKIQQLHRVLDQELEEYFYRNLPVRIDSLTPAQSTAFREAMLNEYVQVEFPWSQPHVTGTFPQNVNLTPMPYSISASDRPQISLRYSAVLNSQTGNTWPTKVAQDLNGNAMIDPPELEVFQRTVSAECLYVILSLRTDSHGQRLTSLLNSNEIGDTDGDGAKEVLDAFGDPVRFSLVRRPDPATIVALRAEMPPENIEDSYRPEFSIQNGFECVLVQSPVPLLVGQPIGQIRGPCPLNEYGFLIQSVNLGEGPATNQIIPSY